MQSKKCIDNKNIDNKDIDNKDLLNKGIHNKDKYEKGMDLKELRRFGFTISIAIGLLFGLLIPFLKHKPYVIWPWIVAAILFLWTLIIPSTLKNFYKVWMKIGMFLGRINTTILLVLVFFIVITPIGFVMKLFGYRPLNDKFDAKVNTYRKKSNLLPVERMEVPF